MHLVNPLLVVAVALTAACGAPPEPKTEPTSSTGAPTASAAPSDPSPTAERPELTVEACEAKGGKVVGDIGDGAVHRPDYTCESGLPPIGRIALGVEGSVCCTGTTPAAPTSGKPTSSLKIGDKSVAPWTSRR